MLEIFRKRDVTWVLFRANYLQLEGLSPRQSSTLASRWVYGKSEWYLLISGPREQDIYGNEFAM